MHRRHARSYSNRFGPYDEYQVYCAKDTMERLVADSRNPGVQRLLSKAYQCPIKWGGYDRFQFHSKPLFPSEWPAKKVRKNYTSSTETSESVSEHSNSNESFRGSGSNVVGVDNENLFVIDKKGDRCIEETKTSEELPKESNDVYQGNIDRWESADENEESEVKDDDEEECSDEDERKSSTLDSNISQSTETKILPVEGRREIEEGELEEQYETDGSMQQQLLRRVEMVRRLKCDVCSYNVGDGEVIPMRFHLNEAKHYGASLFEGYLYGSEFCPAVTVEREAVKIKDSEISTLIPICPICAEVFPSIWTCAIHSARQHNRNVYSIGKVVDSKVVLVNKEPKCDECGRTFNAQKALHRHWRSTLLHYPYQLPSLDQVNVFSCLYCHTYFGCFLTARLHSCRKHDDRRSKSLGLRVIYIEKSTEQMPLPSLKQREDSEHWLNRSMVQAEMISVSKMQLQNRFKAEEAKKRRRRRNKDKSFPLINNHH